MNIKNSKFLIILLLLVFIPAVCALAKPVKISIDTGHEAEVTILTGKAYVKRADSDKELPLEKGEYLYAGDTIRTDKKSRIEIRLPDKSFMRFSADTTFVLEALLYDKKERKRDIKVKMVLGKTWAKVYKFFSGYGRFAISTKTAVAGVRGTVYRVNANSDNSAMIKVYWGEVVVKKQAVSEAEMMKSKISQPTPVSGPTPVAGPTPVSIEEWTHIVRSMQEIIIRPDGTATKPFRFTAKSDLNDWVKWNQDLDAHIR